jgi:plastocyanin
MRRTAAALAVIGVVGALPATASAHKYKVFAGTPTAKLPATVPETTQLNRFYPGKLKVRAGDKVQYTNYFIHTVTALGKGEKRAGLAAPAPGKTYSGINDPQGNPFFFNGLLKFEYDAAGFTPVGSTTVGDGKRHGSGVFGQVPGNFTKYTLKFAKPGTYTVICALHPGMDQKVKVLKKQAKGANTDVQVNKEIVKQSQAGYKNAIKASKTAPPPGTVYAGAEVKNATLLAFLPETITVSKGTTVTFQNAVSKSEVHDMAWGPDATIGAFMQTTDLLPGPPGAPNQVTPGFIYGTQPSTAAPPALAFDYTGSEYGSGFLLTPLLGTPGGQLPSDTKVTFKNPGTYTYYCALHGKGMHGTVIVTE